jgi:hypothetical protein
MPETKFITVNMDWWPPVLEIQVNWLGLVVSIVFFILLIMLIKWLMKKNHYRLNSMELSLPMGMSISIERNEATLYIANRIYVELMTRKAALVFDPDHDHLIEVYDSLYVLFKTIREELKNIPGGYLKGYPTSQELLSLGITILNMGLRPHLTQYQARYRTWYAIEQPKYPELSPQLLQKKYPNYEALVEDLQIVNVQISAWAKELGKLLSVNYEHNNK